MYVVTNRITVQPAFAKQFEDVFIASLATLEDTPGLVRHTVMRPTQEGQPYVTTMEFSSKEDFLKWMKSESFKTAHTFSDDTPKEALGDQNVVESFEVISDSNETG